MFTLFALSDNPEIDYNKTKTLLFKSLLFVSSCRFNDSKVIMLKLLIISLFVCSVYGYFTLPGICPEGVQLQGEFRLTDVSFLVYQSSSA